MINCIKKYVKFEYFLPIFALIAGTAAFVFVPMAFSPDSSGYIKSALSLFQESTAVSWDSFRGPVIPTVLSLFFKVFGATVFAVKMNYYFYYVIMFFSVYKTLELLGMFKNKSRIVTWSLFIFALVLNPMILAYSHLCLSEFPALTILCVYTFIMTKLYLKPLCDARMNFVLKLIVVSIFTVLIYATKQALFVAVPAMFFACELVLLIKEYNHKKAIATFVALVIVACSLFGYLQLWVNVMDGESVEGESVSSYAGTFLIDGLRYFKVTERGVYNKPVLVQVMRSDYETMKSSFEYTFTNSLLDSVKYFFRCLSESPLDVFNSYRSNYLLVSGTRHLLGASGNERAYARVNSSTEFFKGQENAAWTDAFAKIDQGENENFKLKNDLLNPISERDSDAYNNSAARLALFNSYYRKLAYFQYSFITYHALLIAVVSLAFIAKNRKKRNCTLVHNVNFVCALTIFLQILFLAITAQGIDRYGFILNVFCFMIVVNSFGGLTSWIFRKKDL